MKPIATVLPLQKALAFALALVVFTLAVVVPARGDSQLLPEGQGEALVAVSPFQHTPGLPSVSDATLKVYFASFALASLWNLLLLNALEVQEHQAFEKHFFLKVNFVFVSAKAP